MKTKLKKLVRSAKCLVLSAALCAVGLSAWAEPDAVQLWKDGPYWATVNVGTAEQGVPTEYGALYKFNDDEAKNAAENLGEGWRLPSDAEWQALLDNCDKGEWTEQNSVKGRRFTSKSDPSKSIFLPAAGYGVSGIRISNGSSGCYCSSAEKDSTYMYNFGFYDKDANVSESPRTRGLSVRAVKDPPTPTPPEPSDEEVVATAEATFVLGPALAVANVKTATHWPWDGKIDITCDLTGMGKVQLSAALTTNGVTVCTAKAENLTGETTINLDAAGGVTNGVKFVWNAKADCPASFNSTDTKVKVTAKKAPPPPAGQLWEGGPIWAENNLGATTPEDYGILTNFNDAAQAVTDALGTGWRVPSDEELKMLAGKNDGDKVCSNVWTTCNGVAGRRFFGMTSGYEDKSIFLPAAGNVNGGSRQYAENRGYYWSSAEKGTGQAWALFFNGNGTPPYTSYYARGLGCSVRAVRNAK